MPRERTGSLSLRKDGYYVRLFVRDATTGEVTRPWYKLNTHDPVVAARLRDQLNAQTGPKHGAKVPEGATTFREYSARWFEARVARGVAQVASERGWLANHINPVIGDKPLAAVTSADVRAIVEACVSHPLRRQTITHVLATVRLVLDQAWREEAIAENPATRVQVPRLREVARKRVILTDDEIMQFFGCEDIDIEMRMMGLAARCEGGMRTRDLTAWDWTMIDRERFAKCIVPRTKTGAPQELEIPSILAAPLERWWVLSGRPPRGPVFPVTRGKRKGEARLAQGVSFADRLRRALRKAGITRHEVFEETAFSLPVDFHSFRRAYSTALANAGVNAQRAMVLAGHADPRAHARYIMATPQMVTMPEAALPQWPVASERGTPTGSGGCVGARGIAHRGVATCEPAEPRAGAPRSIATGIATTEEGSGKFLNDLGAGHEVRTRDPQLGKLMLYQLS